MANTKTTASKKETTDAQIAKADKTARQKLVAKFSDEEQVPVNLSPMYQPYFGVVMPVIINGIMISVPVDGRTYNIPKSFAAEVFARRNAIDDQQRKGARMADVAKNGEAYIGELKFS